MRTHSCRLRDNRISVQLSLHADYALRVLVYLGSHPDRVISTQEISGAYGISKNHLVRVVQTLAEHGYIQIKTGRSGGVMLAREPEKIPLGNVIRDAEPNLRLVECFDRETNTCVIAPVCGLKRMLQEAMDAFLASGGCAEERRSAEAVRRFRHVSLRTEAARPGDTGRLTAQCPTECRSCNRRSKRRP
jgi:Rrf2 family nitric oxide-sensitive transcriptional repressor